MNQSRPLARSRTWLLPVLLLMSISLIALAILPAVAIGREATALQSTTTGVLQTKILPTDPAATNFGEAIDADGDLLLVGAPYTDAGANQAGKAYLLRQDTSAPSGWAPVHAFQHPSPRGYAYLGLALAIDGDTVIAGAPSDPRPMGFINGGSVSLFERNAGGPDAWGFVTELQDEVQEDWRWFGRSVALDGNLAAASVMGADNGAGTRDAGKVLIYSRDAGWAQIADVDDPFGARDDQFGWSLALQGDTLVVGANFGDAGSTAHDTGVVYIFERNEGGPDAWGLIARLTAETPWPEAAFGYSLSLEGDLLAVGAATEDRIGAGLPTVPEAGAVYLFQRNEGGPNAWGQIAALRLDDPTETEGFGTSVALNGDDLWVGIPYSERGGPNDRGAVARFSRNHGGPDAWGLVEIVLPEQAAHFDQFGSGLAARTGGVLVSAPNQDGHGVVYDLTAPDVAPTLYPVMFPITAHDWTPPAGTLYDAASLENAGGAIIGAVSGTLPGPLAADIFPVALPAGLPAEFVVRGDAYRLLSGALSIAPSETPFLVGLPVPAGADVTRLGAALNLSSGLVTESSGPPDLTRRWTTAPGVYDPATNLFVFTVSALLPEGITAVLYEHEDNRPLAAPPTVANRTTTAATYSVTCDPNAVHKDVCSVPTLVALVKDELEQAHTEFVDTHGYAKPALVHGVGAFVGPNKIPQLYETDYQVRIASTPCTNTKGEPILGEYSYVNDLILVCVDQSAPSSQIRDTVRHELFHAIQAAYPAVAADYIAPSRRELTHWTLEGSATAAERSGFLMVRNPDWPIHKVTEPMTSTVDTVEYHAQDFWVFTGLEGDQTDHYISYLRQILAQGATPEHVNNAMNLGDAYWEWAKNQALEHYQTMVGAFSRGACELDLRAVGDLTNINVMSYPSEQLVEGRLPPLTTAVVLIRTAIARASLYVDATTSGDEAEFRFKVYETEGLAGCRDLPDGSRTLQDVPAEGSRFVLVSNLSVEETIDYAVFVE